MEYLFLGLGFYLLVRRATKKKGLHHSSQSSHGSTTTTNTMQIHGQHINTNELMKKLKQTQHVINDDSLNEWHAIIDKILHLQFRYGAMVNGFGRWEDITNATNCPDYLGKLEAFKASSRMFQDADFRYEQNLLVIPGCLPVSISLDLPLAYQIYLWAYQHFSHGSSMEEVSWKIASNLNLLYTISTMNRPNATIPNTTNSNKKTKRPNGTGY